MGFKITNFGNDKIKCGFPINSYDKYMKIFDRLGIDIEEVSYNDSNGDDLNIEYIIKTLKDIDINKLTPLEAFDIIKKFKDRYE